MIILTTLSFNRLTTLGDFFIAEQHFRWILKILFFCFCFCFACQKQLLLLRGDNDIAQETIHNRDIWLSVWFLLFFVFSQHHLFLIFIGMATFEHHLILLFNFIFCILLASAYAAAIHTQSDSSLDWKDKLDVPREIGPLTFPSPLNPPLCHD